MFLFERVSTDYQLFFQILTHNRLIMWSEVTLTMQKKSLQVIDLVFCFQNFQKGIKIYLKRKLKKIGFLSSDKSRPFCFLWNLQIWHDVMSFFPVYYVIVYKVFNFILKIDSFRRPKLSNLRLLSISQSKCCIQFLNGLLKFRPLPYVIICSIDWYRHPTFIQISIPTLKFPYVIAAKHEW